MYNNTSMLINKLSIKNFRNYTGEKIEFSPGLNILTGVNASGKTNLLEAVYLLGIGRSPRTSSDKEMILWGQDFLYVNAEIARKHRVHRIEMHIDKSSKRIAVDGLPIGKVGELMGVLNVVYFSPDELKLVKESPKERRRFMDISLSQQNKVYFYNLLRYNRILDQRNKLLKTAYSFAALKNMLPVWDIQLADAGSDLILARRSFIEKLNIHAGHAHAFLTDNKEELTLSYEADASTGGRDELKALLTAAYAADAEKDYSLKYTTMGPHRDDIRIQVNNVDTRKFGSQGQQRSAALALKLAELDHFERETGEKPVLLLDDVLSELDAGRREKLIEATAGAQTILTCTEYDGPSSVPYKLFKIHKGSIE